MLGGSYLEESFLGGSDVIMEEPVPQQQVAPMLPSVTSDKILLPGGVVIPRKTLYVLAAAVLVAAFIWWKKNKDR